MYFEVKEKSKIRYEQILLIMLIFCTFELIILRLIYYILTKVNTFLKVCY